MQGPATDGYDEHLGLKKNLLALHAQQNKLGTEYSSFATTKEKQQQQNKFRSV